MPSESWFQALQSLFTIRHQLEEIAAEQTRHQNEFTRFGESVDGRLRELEVAVAKLEEGRQTMRAEMETELLKARERTWNEISSLSVWLGWSRLRWDRGFGPRRWPRS